MYTPIVPSSLFSAEDPSITNNANTHTQANFGLKSGVIVKTYDIGDKDNISKITVEYDVVAIEKKVDGSFASTLFKRCVALESFGGLADFFEYKQRNPTNTEFEKNGKIKDSDGSLVALLCLNGDSDKAVIIGCLKHPARSSKLTKETGKHLEGEFNGLSWKVNKDGELVIKFNSETDNKGKPKNTEAQGSYTKFDKDGNIHIGTQIAEGGKQEAEIVSLSKKDKKIRIKSREVIEIEAKDKDLSTKSGGNTSITSAKDLLASAQGRATIIAKGNMGLLADGNLDMKGASVNIQSNGAFSVQASNISMSGSSVSLGRGGSPAITMNTVYVGTGNYGMPVVSTPVGPFSSVVTIAS
jgi:hypothetical protein